MRHLWPAILALLAVLSVAACYSRDQGNGPITSFTAERSKITKGMPDKLIAVFDSGIGTIDNGIGEVVSGVPIETAKLAGNTTFTLSVIADTGDTFSQSVVVTTVDPATITSFAPDKVVHPGESVMLTAVFAGGTGVVDGGIGPVISGQPKTTGVLPETKIYKLTVTNEAGDSVTADAEAEAAVTPVIVSFSAPGAVVSRYTPTTLTAVFTGGKGTVDQGVGKIVTNMPGKTPEVPAAGTTFTLTVTNGLGESVKKSLSVTTKKEIFVTDYGADILVFDIDQTGDVEPKRIVVTELTTVGILGLAIANDEIFMANEGAAGGPTAITVYDINEGVRPPYMNGGTIKPPKRKIAGPATTIFGAYMLSVDAGEIFLSDKTDFVKIWNVTDTGNVAPKRTLGGPASGLSNTLATWVTGGELYTSNFANGGAAGGITVHPRGASGNTPPTRTILTSNPTGVVVSGDEVFVSAKEGDISVFNKTSGALLRKISGPATQITELYQCSVADNELFCASYQKSSALAFPLNSSGNVAPIRSISGDKSYLSATGCLVVY